jgi:hypothetical protein
MERTTITADNSNNNKSADVVQYSIFSEPPGLLWCLLEIPTCLGILVDDSLGNQVVVFKPVKPALLVEKENIAIEQCLTLIIVLYFCQLHSEPVSEHFSPTFLLLFDFFC